MENTFELSMEKMSMSQLEQLEQLLKKEIDSRQKEARKEAERKIFELLKTIEGLCTEHNIDLYDRHDNIIYFDEITL